MSVTWNGEARARLDQHLDAVEQALAAAGNSRERRRAVVDDLEAQIQEMLQARSKTPTLEDVEAVLAKLDPPAAYSAVTGVIPPPAAKTFAPRPRYSRTAIWGLVCIIASLLPVLLVIPVAFLFLNHTRYTPSQMHRTAEAPALVEPARISPTTAPASAEDMVADRKTYAEFMSMLHAKRLVSVAAVNDGKTVTISGTCRGTSEEEAANQPGEEIFTTMAASAMDGENWQRLRAAARDSGATFTVAASGAPPEPAAAPNPVRRAKTSSQINWADFAPLSCLMLFVSPLALLGTILGWIAFAQIRSSNGAFRGKGFALFDGLFYPVLILPLLLVLPFGWIAILGAAVVGAGVYGVRRMGAKAA